MHTHGWSKILARPRTQLFHSEQFWHARWDLRCHNGTKPPQTHESNQTHQKEDPSSIGSEENRIGQSDQDSLGATSEVLSL